jgi:hypothetical protein
MGTSPRRNASTRRVAGQGPTPFKAGNSRKRSGVIEGERDSRCDYDRTNASFTLAAVERRQLKEKALARACRHAHHQAASWRLRQKSADCRFLRFALIFAVAGELDEHAVRHGGIDDLPVPRIERSCLYEPPYGVVFESDPQRLAVTGERKPEAFEKCQFLEFESDALFLE